MKNAKFLCLIAVIFTSSCAYSRLDENLHHLEQQNINVAIDYLGIPDNKLVIDDKEVFYWESEDIRTYSRPIHPYGGYSSGRGGYGGVGIVFGAVGSPYGYEDYRYYCVIKALTDKNHIIETIEYESTAGGCSKYNEAMKAIESDFKSAQ